MSEQGKMIRLDRLCDSFRGRLVRLVGLTGMARVIVLLLVLFGGIAVVDWALHMQAAMRVLFLMGYMVAVGVTVWFTLVRPLSHKWSNREVLAYVDESVPDSEGLLLDLYELETAREHIQEVQTETGRGLADQAIHDIAPVAQRVELGTAFARRTANRWLLGAVALVALLVLAIVIPQSRTYVAIGAERLFNPFSSQRWPHRTTIIVYEPQTGWAVEQLGKFDVDAEVTGEVPARVQIVYKGGSGTEIREWVQVEDRQVKDDKGGERTARWVQYSFPEVKEPVTFYLRGGDYTTDDYEIEIIRQPFITQITAEYDYPDYTGLPDKTLKSGQLSGLEGTQVKLTFETSMPLKRAVLVYADEKSVQAHQSAMSAQPKGEGEAAAAGSAALPPGAQHVELSRTSDTLFTHSLMLRENARYAIELYEEKHGFREKNPEIYEIRVTLDDLPEVELLAPGRDLVETNRAKVGYSFVARDTLGLAKVQFLYQIDDNPPQQLTDHITGPIEQTGSVSKSNFEWDLSRSKLPAEGTLTYWVRAQDNNPTGRGVADSRKGQVKIVKGSQFHLDAIERAKLLEEEARNAWRNQLHAWLAAKDYLANGTGDENDKIWLEMVDKQQRAMVATRQVKFHLATLTEKYERNQMQRDFMSGRLKKIGELLNNLMKEQEPITEGLDRARPRTAAEAKPEVLKGRRGGAINGFKDNQKMAVLILERLLFKVYDWRDLQFATVTTKLLYEQQEEVLAKSREMAPRWIGKDIKDLSDSDQEVLLTLGKQQTAIRDTEKGLEEQLQYLMLKAEKMQRNSIRRPLDAAFKNLRDNRVLDNLKLSAQLIESNQTDQIINNQEAVIRALQVVQAGLEMAGQNVDEDPMLTLAMTPKDEDKIDPSGDIVVAVKTDEPSTAANPENTIQDLIREQEKLRELDDKLSHSLRLSIESMDNVLARTRYLSRNNSDAEMPRFIRLKLLMLDERQLIANQLISGAVEVAKEVATDPKKLDSHRMGAKSGDVVAWVQTEFQQSHKLLKAKQVDTTVQGIQSDSKETLDELIQFVAMEQDALNAVEENRRLNGKDGFGRDYQLKDKDLDLALEILSDVNHARQYQLDVVRKLARFQAAPASGESVAVETANRARAAAAQKKAGELIDAAVAKAKKLSTEKLDAKVLASPAEAMAATGVLTLAELKLAGFADEVAAGKKDAELCPPEPIKPDTRIDKSKMSEDEAKQAEEQARQAIADWEKQYRAWAAARGPLREAGDVLGQTVTSLRRLLEERVQRQAEIVTAEAAADLTMQKVLELGDIGSIAEKLKRSDIPEDLRDLMVRSLERQMGNTKRFVKYDELLKRYYASFISAEANEEKKDGSE